MKQLFFVSLLIFTACAQKVVTQKAPAGPIVYKNEKLEVLSNGLKIYFLDDQSLPRVSLQLLIPVGVVSESAELAGLNSMTANLLDQGTTSKKALEIGDLFADSGAELEVQGGSDFTMMTTSSLVTEFPTVLKLYTEVLMEPSFPKAEIDRIRQQTLVALKGRQDRSGPWADHLMQKNFYTQHAYGRDSLGSPESLKKITRDDVVQFYKNNYAPNQARLAVTGRLTPEIQNQIRSQFGQWKALPQFSQINPAFVSQNKSSITKLASPQKAQTEIRFIQSGISRSSPDYLKLRLVNEVLGGGFASRLNQRVRDDLGLTYSIHSSLDTRKSSGAWIISTFSKNASAPQTVEEVFQVVKKFLAEGITKDELAAAKNLVKSQLPRALETSDRLAYNLVALDYYGIDASYLINFNRNIDSFSLDEINSTLRQYLKPDEMQVLVYGQQPVAP